MTQWHLLHMHEDTSSEAQNPRKCQEGEVAHMQFQPLKVETGDPQIKLVSQTSHMADSGFDEEIICPIKMDK